MDKQKKKPRDWSFLLLDGKPAHKHRLELKKIKDMMAEQEVDVDGVDFETEENFRDFVMAKTTPKDDIDIFLKSIFEDAAISYKETRFRRLAKKDCLDLFFDLFTFGLSEGETEVFAEPEIVVSSEDKTESKEEMTSSDTSVAAEEPVPLTMAKVDALYKSKKKEIVTSISYADFAVTNKMPVRAQDHFDLRLRDNAPAITYSRAALFNTHLQKTVAVGHLIGDRQKPSLVFRSEDMDFASIQKNRRHEILLFPKDEKDDVFYAVRCELAFRELEEVKRTLCLDFGTSNTTAGSYGILDEQANVPEIVKFPDVDGITTRQMLPTLVYVVSCEEGQPIHYAFGYEARKRIAADHFESRATVFHEIKSWMNDLARMEEIFDAEGNNAVVRREDVIKAYLSYVISLSEQYFHKSFKYLHFSAPVKLKESFLGKMRQMFPDYVVLKDDSSLDEGIAIVYNHIDKRINNLEEGKTETVFVVDCGGGTTDLARCEYSQMPSSIGEGKKVLSVKTSFENGDSAFGGNNITYRILQLLKIKIDAYLRQLPNPDMLELLSDNEIDIMTKLDEPPEGKNIYDVKEDLYRKFTEAYQAAEERIPTRYRDAEFNDDRRAMRRNYNYLWQMAEAIKIEFYKSSSTVSVDFTKEEDRNICIGGQEDYYLYTRVDEKAAMEKKTAPLGNICITIKEISRIICPDIYTLLSILFGGYDNQTLQGVDYYKLSGQSCNITLFHDLMKEFVPGRDIRRSSQSVSDEDRSEELKIACLEGSIRYLMAKEYSQIQPKIEMDKPHMLYQVFEKGAGCVLGKDGDCERAYLLRNFMSGRRVHLVVRDDYEQQKNSIFYNFETETSKYEKLSLPDLQLCLAGATYWSADKVEDIISELHDITLQSEADGEQCVFLLPAKNGYGFRVYQVRVGYSRDEGTTYSLIRHEANDDVYGVYYSFEQMASFFDGTR